MKSTIEILECEAIAGLKAIPDASVDLVLTDPPYAIAAKGKTTKRGSKIVSTLEAFGAWDTMHAIDHEILVLQLISEVYRILKPGGSLYFFTSREDQGVFIRRARERGFTYRNQLAMVKTNPLPSFSKSNWRSAFETCAYLTKGRPKTFNFLSQQTCVNVHSYTNHERETRHPTEKPLSLFRRIIEVSSNPGDLVVDPFLGSGTTAVACQELGRSFLGFDFTPEYVRMARKRVERAQCRKEDAA